MVKRGFRKLAVVAAMSLMLNPAALVFAETGRVNTDGPGRLRKRSGFSQMRRIGRSQDGWFTIRIGTT